MRNSADSVSLSPNNVGGDRETGRPSGGFGVGQEPRATCGDVGPDDPERWLPVTVEPFGDRYEVSSLGRVRRTKAARGTHAGKILAGAAGPNGYPIVNLSAYADGIILPRYIHDLVARAFIGEPPAGHEVDHRDHIRRGRRSLDGRARGRVGALPDTHRAAVILIEAAPQYYEHAERERASTPGEGKPKTAFQRLLARFKRPLKSGGGAGLSLQGLPRVGGPRRHPGKRWLRARRERLAEERGAP